MAAVARVKSDDVGSEAEYEITVLREVGYGGGPPSAQDLPADIRGALLAWLGVSEGGEP